MPRALRRLFATILIFCKPSDPLALWQKYYEHLSKDFKHQYMDMKAKVQQLTAREIQRHLEEMGKSLEEFGLQDIIVVEDDGLRKTKDIDDVLDAPIPNDYIKAITKLNYKQQEAFDCIIDHVTLNKPCTFFYRWPGRHWKDLPILCLIC